MSYTYKGTTYDAGGRTKGRKPIQHGTTKAQYNRCKERELGACAECKAASALDEARRRAARDPRNAVLLALRAFAEAQG